MALCELCASFYRSLVRLLREGYEVTRPTEEIRRIARSARRLGFTAVQMGNWTEAEWDAAIVALRAEDASNGMLADAVDLVATLEGQTMTVDDQRRIL